MAELTARFESSLPISSFDIVKQAAAMSGMTLKSFVASAAYNTALEMLNKRERTINFSEKDWEQLQYYMKHPELFDSSVEKAMAATQNIGRIVEKPEDRIC